MQFILVTLALAATAIAATTGGKGDGVTCKSDQQVVCKDNGNGVLTLGNVLPGALGEDCSGGDVYCCSSSDVASGLIGLNVDVQCDLNRVL
ncbi:hypothetical protein N7486_000992 [Penicillium sp. IBT 16267x]|nr:hypothetical protein N7486_000992 [Penicillium sp. IBT 16267x]